MNNLLNDIRLLSEEAKDLENKIANIDTKINETSLDQVYGVIKECKGGFKFNKIVIEKLFGINTICTFGAEKGVFLKQTSMNRIMNEYTLSKNEFAYYEVWLMENGDLSLYRVVEAYNTNATEPCELYRTHCDDDILQYFNIDDMLSGLKNALLRKMNSLNNRTKAQEERIEKLNKYMQ